MLSALSEGNEMKTLIGLSWEEIENLKQKNYFCPGCKEQLIIKNSRIRLPHFSHTTKQSCPSSSERETLEHLFLKETFALWCEQECLDYKLEPFLFELSQRPDLLIGKAAIEIQCSPLSVRRLIERTHMYQRHNYTPIWILGYKLTPSDRISELVKSFCYYSNQLGFYLWTVDWKQKEITLLFHIEEDWKGKVYYSKKTWNFYSNSLRHIFSFPITGKIYSKRIYLINPMTYSYYIDLAKKLSNRNEGIRSIQEILYKNHLHILNLPDWFYYPEIPILCCRRSPLFLKQYLWKKMKELQERKFSKQQLIDFINKEIQYREDLFYDFPNIDKKIIHQLCLEQIVESCIKFDIFVKEIENWKIYLSASKNAIKKTNSFFYDNKIKTFISATPSKSMIR